ncbi:agmatine deiminase family protein [Mycolicibacterium nivoides]|uniref:Agmatine/peptidylarginine deiminase n=1 Tax=Mycolicibacterium nivoides TaxID=2487344 RepID=A0ABW9LLA9_9MYCO
MSYLMPAETDPHERIWLAYPVPLKRGESAVEADEARATWAQVANTIVDFEPVTVVVDPSEESHARRLLSDAVDLEVHPLDDGWIRDNGPTFVHASDGSVAAVTWTFNGWGRPAQHPTLYDGVIGHYVAELAGVPVVESQLVNEGGAIHVDGGGTMLATRTVQLDPMRNPGITEEEVEAEFHRTLGATDVVWFNRGLTADYAINGTKGHVDICVTMPAHRRALVHTQHNIEHPDHILSQEFRRTLECHGDVSGKPWDIIELPAPKNIIDRHGFNDWSYVNHLVVNGGVIACRFGDPNDEVAADILADAYPDRLVVTVDARPLYDRGGGIHCITQQQPKPNRSAKCESA